MNFSAAEGLEGAGLGIRLSWLQFTLVQNRVWDEGWGGSGCGAAGGGNRGATASIDVSLSIWVKKEDRHSTL